MDDYEDEDYQDAASEMFGEEDLFDDADETVIDEELDIDEAVDILYEVIYGSE